VDFGEILYKWEHGKFRGSPKSTMDEWLSKNKVIDKDADEKRHTQKGEKRRRLIHAKPDDVLDIHGLTKETAWTTLEAFFENARNRGCEKLRIIHGKGNHSVGEVVLLKVVQKFIEQCSFAGESGHENAANGGRGATWVLLRMK